MKLFMAVLSRRGPLDSATVERLARNAEPGLPYADSPFRRDIWRAANGLTALVAWDNDFVTQPAPALIVPSGDGARTMSGYVNEPGLRDPWDAGEVLPGLELSPRDVVNLGGVFAIVEAVTAPPVLFAFNVANRNEPVYWQEAPEMIVVASRALLVHLAVTGRERPEIVPSNLASFIIEGYFMNDRTPYRGVQVMPPGSCLVATLDGVSHQRLDDLQDRIGTAAADEAHLDRLASRLLAAVRGAAGRPVRVLLSGGKDSRIVAGACKAAGIPAILQTGGLAENPEVQAAQRVAAALQMPHEVVNDFAEDDAEVRIDVLARVEQALRRTDGMIFGWENIPATVPFDGTIVTGGQGTTAFLGGFSDRIAGKPQPTRADARQALLARETRRAELLHPEALNVTARFVDAWLKERRTLGPEAALDLFQTENQSGRWMAATMGSYSNHLNFSPFHDNQAARLGLRLEAAPKRDWHVSFGLLQRIAPELLDLPLAWQRWPFEASGPFPGREAGWAARAPIVAPAGSRGAFDWRRAWTTDLYEAFYEQIFLNRSADALFDVMRRDALAEWFAARRGTVPKTLDSHLAWGALSASVLLENRWLGASRAHRTWPVPVPV